MFAADTMYTRVVDPCIIVTRYSVSGAPPSLGFVHVSVTERRDDVAARFSGANGTVACGICTAVVVVNSSQFAVPAGAPRITPLVAPCNSDSETTAGDAPGFAPSTSAAAPATCGVAMEVPEYTAVAVVDEIDADVIPTPGP